MDGKRFLNSVKFTNLLSFGPEGMELELQPLNILIGANGCGKSNFIDGLRILKSIPVDMSLPFSKGDTISEWFWKGIDKENIMSINTEIDFGDYAIIYNCNISEEKLRPVFCDENFVIIKNKGSENRHIIFTDGDLIQGNYSESVGKEKYSYQWEVGKEFADHFNSLKNIRVYSDYELGRYSKIRVPQNASLDPGDIFEGFGNLSLVINDLISKPDILNSIIERLKTFYENVKNVNTRTAFGTIQLYLQEENLSETIPATRLSDGTIRFLSLLAILLHPEPPPLICIEEPELGMHPDIIHVIADLLIEASQRTQLIITTHSDILVSAIGQNYPEAIVACDKDEKGTRMKRLDPEKMRVWLEKYSMGELWLSGEIGGGRW